TRIFGVIGNGWRTAQFIADGLVNNGYLDAPLLETGLNLVLDFSAKVDLGHADVTLRVAVDVLEFGHFVRIKVFDKRLGQKNNPKWFFHRKAFDDRAFDNIRDVRKRDAFAAELFRND